MKFVSTTSIIFFAVATSATDSLLRRRKISEEPAIENGIQHESSRALNDGLSLHLGNNDRGMGAPVDAVRMVDFEFDYDDDRYGPDSNDYGKGVKSENITASTAIGEDLRKVIIIVPEKGSFLCYTDGFFLLFMQIISVYKVKYCMFHRTFTFEFKRVFPI